MWVVMNIIRYQLENGLNVVLHAQHTSPVVACNVWVGVGSADEEPHEAGLAHVHEHMLFKGTARRGVGEIAREVESSGGHINAFTSFDQTCYYVVLSSRFFASGIDILADAIRESAFDTDELGRELEVIQEEIKRGNDDPNRVASRMLFETAFTRHPYRLPVIGTKESVDSFDRDDVVRFFRKHYRPDNMTVVLAGDFDEAQARELVAEKFADFEAPRHTRVVRESEPEQTAPRFAVDTQEMQSSQLRVAFHIPNILHEDTPALDVLGAILGFGEASHLHRVIQRDWQLVNAIYAGTYTPRDAGVLVIGAEYELDGEHGHLQIVEPMMTEVFRFRQIKASDADIARARTLIESREIYGKQTVEQIAMKLGQGIMVTGDPDFDAKYYAALAEVTAEDVLRVARKYLTRSNTTVCLLHPVAEEASPTEAELLRSIEAAFERVEAEAIDAGVEPNSDGLVMIDLPDGPRVIVQEDHAVETFAIRALTLGGLRYETPANNGVSWLLGELLTRGTPARDAVEIAHSIESMASSLSGISGRHSFGLGAGGLRRFFQPTFEIFADCLVNSSVPDEEFEREQRLLLQNLRSRKDRLGTVNFDRFTERFFGAHPYGMPVAGTEESVGALTAEDARAFLTRVLRPQDLVIGVVGDVDASEVIELVQRHMVRPADRPQWTPEIPAAPARTGRSLVQGDLAREQAFVTVGFDAPPMGDNARYPMEVLNAVLSGQGGRLFYELRDRQSLAYSVYANMLFGLDAGAFMINIGTSPEKIEQAVRGIFAEVERLTTEPPSGAELERAQRYLIGSHDIGLQRNSSRAMSFTLDELYGFGPRKTLGYSDRIAEVNVDDLTRFVQTYLNVDRAVVAVTKPPGVEPDLSSFVQAEDR